MTDPNMPNNTLHASIYLKAKKQVLLELVNDIVEHEMGTVSQVSGLITGKLEVLDEQLEEYL